MPQPRLQDAPIQHGLYGIVRQTYPDRVDDLETYLGIINESDVYLHLRDHFIATTQAQARTMHPDDAFDMFSQHAEEMPPHEFKPTLRTEEQISLASQLWQGLLLGGVGGDFVGLTDFSFLSYLFKLEAISKSRALVEYEEILLTAARQLVRSDLSDEEGREIFLRLDRYTINPPVSYETNCSLLTKLTTEMLWGGVTLLLRLPFTDYMPHLPHLLRPGREHTQQDRQARRRGGH